MRSLFFETHIDEFLKYISENIKDSASLSQEDVITNLSLCHLKRYLQNNKVTIDFIKPLKDIAGKNGHPFSLFILGMMNIEGLGDLVAEDKRAGYSYVTLSAENRCHFANNVKGCSHVYGNDFVEKDLKKALNCFNTALELVPNDRRTLRNLGLCYLYNNDPKSGIAYLGMAEKNGDDTLARLKAMNYANNNEKIAYFDGNVSKQKNFPNQILSLC